MSCQSLAARAFAEPEKDAMTHSAGFHRTVRFSSESRSANRTNNVDSKRETPGSISLTTLAVTPVSQMSQSAPSHSGAFDISSDTPPPSPACRFPKLEECAHFHYERVSLGGLMVQLASSSDTSEHEDCQHEDEGWVCLKVRSHVSSSLDDSIIEVKNSSSWTEAGGDCSEWTLSRNRENFLQLDQMLHRCIYDRKVSGLPNLSEKLGGGSHISESDYRRLVADYVHHLSIIADDSINCAPVLNWLQCDNKGHKLLVANEDSSSINTPAVAAAYSVRKYVSQARDEISFEVGDMISIIDMPGPQESLWWRGKRGFRVGFFPHHCVAVIGDKVPRHMTQPPPIVGSVAVAPIKPVLRKHGKLISLFRSFILSRPSRRSLKQQGILKERVFGCDLGEHLLNCGHDVPMLLVQCCAAIEAGGVVDGVYRLSGGAGLTQRLRAAFDSAGAPDLTAPAVLRDPHCVASLLKMYCRELPNPLCTYQLYDSFVSAVQQPDEASRLKAVRDTVVKLPPPHYRTLSYLMRHLRRVSLQSARTGMTARNMAIVWAPNLLRSPAPQHALHGVAVQAVVTEFLICYAEELFSEEQGEDSAPSSIEPESLESQIEYRNTDSCSRRPKSLPLHPPTKLLSLEEARRRGKAISSIQPPSIESQGEPLLRVEAHLKPKYIEVGSGPNNLPQYHTVLDLPLPGSKRGLKRSPSGWRGLFARKQRARTQPALQRAPPAVVTPDVPMPPQLRPVKSCESLTSETDTLAPLAETNAPLKHHTRSSSCDSYFEPWQAELADMRLRLSPQERDRHMFSEEDDTHHNHHHLYAMEDSLCSTPVLNESGLCSVEPSPRRALNLDVDAANEYSERKRSALEEQLSQIGYIDVESPRSKPPEKRTCNPATTHSDIAKRLCTDRDSPRSSVTDFQTSIANVKLRERSSPRKTRNTSRYSGMHQPLNLSNDNDSSLTAVNSRLSWHGKDGHSTLIKVDWPAENSSVSNLTASTINSTPLTPVTPVYDQLESDSDKSDANKHTIKVESDSCQNCAKEKCLKCELGATDYGNVKDCITIESDPHDSLEHTPVKDISYQNLNRLSAVSTSSNSEPTDSRKKDVTYENCDLKAMTSSHESSSSYSNLSPLRNSDELYECYNFARPNYINLSSSSKSSPVSPSKSPLKSTISITFRSPTKTKSPDYEPIDNIDTPTNERDSVYEDIDLEKNLSIVEEAALPVTDASLPTQQACQPDSIEDLIILETPTEHAKSADVYSQVKFFKKSVEEVNAMILESPEREEQKHYENVIFDSSDVDINYENVDAAAGICDKVVELRKQIDNKDPGSYECDNGNSIKEIPVSKNLNVRELANRFESPTEQKGPFTFEKFKAEIKHPTLERREDKTAKVDNLTLTAVNVTSVKPPSPAVSTKTFNLSKGSGNARSLDENAFVKEFGDRCQNDRSYSDRRKSFDVKDGKKQTKFLPDLNLNLEEGFSKIDSITPTTENKISLIQRFDIKKPSELTTLIGFDAEKKLSRERIEKYKEERRNFLREKYSSQSFRSNTEQLTRLKVKKDDKASEKETGVPKFDISEKETQDLPKFERRNTVDLGQRMRFSLAKSANNLDTIQSPVSPKEIDFDSAGRSREFDRKEKISPSYNIRDMAALFEQKSQNNTNSG